MKGILIKDCYLIWGYGKSLFGICALFLLVSQFSPDVNFSYLIVPLFSMLTVTSIAIDERCGWEKYVNVLPVSRKQVVLAKYLLSWALIAFSSLLVSLLTAVIGVVRHHALPENLLENGFFMAALALLYSAVCLPIIFRYGVEKGRLFYVFAMAALAFALSFFSQNLSGKILSFATGTYSGLILLGISLVCSGLSLFLSVFFNSKKEF